MSIATDVSRIKGNISAALAAIADKGVTVPAGSTSDALASLIASIEAGGGGGCGEYEISTGIITPAENTESLSFEHGLSKAPSFVQIFLPIGYPVSSFSNALRSMYFKKSSSGERSDERFDVYASRSQTKYLYHENAKLGSDVYFDINDTTVTAPGCSFNGGTVRIWLAGKPYHWICIAGEVVFPYT